MQKRIKRRETKHTFSHLLQSKCSSNIRGTAYPLPPCVKPFTRMCRDSLGNRAAAALAGLHSVHEHRLYSEVHWQDRHRQSVTTPDVYLLSTSAAPPRHNRKSCIGTTELHCKLLNAELKGQFESLHNQTKQLNIVFVAAVFQFQEL